eukprot:361044-Chlamydomonas_euryale.AAC.5
MLDPAQCDVPCPEPGPLEPFTRARPGTLDRAHAGPSTRHAWWRAISRASRSPGQATAVQLGYEWGQRQGREAQRTGVAELTVRLGSPSGCARCVAGPAV